MSHSHADQNSFCILKGGRALSIASGYYGPAYSAPHHHLWTRQTKANNSVLVNGEGQIVRDAGATGRIAQFRHQRALTYVCGDASAAYGGKLGKFVRHVLFLRPGVFVMLDELEAPQPAQFEWLLHAIDEMKVDAAGRTVISQRDGATLTANLNCDAGLSFAMKHAFDTPYNEGNPPEYHEDKADQWHFTASTDRRVRETRIAAAMVVRGPGENFTTAWKQHPGWSGVSIETDDGAGEVWAQLSPGASSPPNVGGSARLAGWWNPRRGAKETLLV